MDSVVFSSGFWPFEQKPAHLSRKGGGSGTIPMLFGCDVGGI